MRLILSLVFVLTLFSSVFADDLLTLGDFRREAQNQSSLKTDPFYPDSVWNSWINEACHDLANYGIIEKLDTVNLTSGTMIYSLNSDFIRLLSASYLRPTNKPSLDFISVRDINKVHATTPEPRTYWQVGKAGNAVIGFFAPPTLSDTVLIIYGAEANFLSSDTDTTDVPYGYRPLIIDYVVYRALLRNGKGNNFEPYYDSYMKRLAAKLELEQKRFDAFVKPQEIE